MDVLFHNDEYFENTPIEKQRVCCNCRHRKMPKSVCEIDGHRVGYVACFECWCRHWASGEDVWEEI